MAADYFGLDMVASEERKIAARKNAVKAEEASHKSSSKPASEKSA